MNKKENHQTINVLISIPVQEYSQSSATINTQTNLEVTNIDEENKINTMKPIQPHKY